METPLTDNCSCFWVRCERKEGAHHLPCIRALLNFPPSEGGRAQAERGKRKRGMKAERGRDRRCTMEEVWTGSLTERERERAAGGVGAQSDPSSSESTRASEVGGAHVRRARARRAHGAAHACLGLFHLFRSISTAAYFTRRRRAASWRSSHLPGSHHHRKTDAYRCPTRIWVKGFFGSEKYPCQ